MALSKAATNAVLRSVRRLILVKEQPILVQHRRPGRAVIVVDHAELAVPHDLPAHVDGDQPVPPERCVDTLAVGRGRRRRVAVLVVDVLDAVLRNERLPQHTPVGAAERDHRHAASVVARRGQEQAVAPDDRRRVATARHGHLPLDAARGRPRIRVLRLRHMTLRRGATPLRPVLRALPFDRDDPDVLRRRRRGAPSPAATMSTQSRWWPIAEF